MVCLDTDFLVALLRNNPQAVEKASQLVEKNEKITITSITLTELFLGAFKSRKKEHNIKAIKELVENIELLDFDSVAAEKSAKIIFELEKKGLKIGSMDSIIAGIVLSHKEKLVTNNSKHFNRIKGLKIINW